MSGISDYLEHELLNATIRGVTYTSPTTVWLGIGTSGLDDKIYEVPSGVGASIEYRRMAITFYGQQVSGLTYNDTQIDFPEATSTWGTVSQPITKLGLFDQGYNGNLLYHGDLVAAKAVASGQQFQVLISGVTAQLF